MTIKFNIKGIQPVEDSGGGGGLSAGWVAKYALVEATGSKTVPEESYATGNFLFQANSSGYVDSDLECQFYTSLDSAYGVYLLFDDDITTVSGNVSQEYPIYFKSSNEVLSIKVYTTAEYVAYPSLCFFHVYGTNNDADQTNIANMTLIDKYPFGSATGNTWREAVLTSHYKYYAVFFATEDGNTPVPVNEIKLNVSAAALATPLISSNMTPEIESYLNDYMQIKTQLYKNSENTIQPYTLTMKPYTDGGNLIGYVDDGSAVNLNLYALIPDGDIETDYIYILAKDSTFSLPVGYTGSILVGKIYIPAHYYNNNGSWEMGEGGEEPIDDRTPVLKSLTITPTTSAQTIDVERDIDGYAPIYVKAFDNTKYGVSIDNILGNANNNNVLQEPSGSFNFTLHDTITGLGIRSLYYKFYRSKVSQVDLSSITSINGENALGYAFSYSSLTSLDLSGLTSIGYNQCTNMASNCQYLTTVDLSSLTSINGNYACQAAFQNCSNLVNLNLSNLTTVNGDSACSNMFSNAGLTSVNLSKLTTISGACSNMFNNCTKNTTVDLSSLVTINGQSVCYGMFNSNIKLTSIDISKLTTIIGNTACRQFFAYCSILETVSFTKLEDLTGSQNTFQEMFNNASKMSNIYFNALKTTSFGSYTNQFNSMFNSNSMNVSGNCTIHFPSNMESTIQGLTGYPNFGATSGRLTLAFDLPATA